MPELRWTLLILGALFIGGLALWEWRRQRHARGAGGAASPHAGGREGERISPTFDGASEVSFAEHSASHTSSRPTFREPTLTFPEVSVEMPVDSRDRFADPPVVELDDASLDRLKVEAGEAVDEFSEPREPGEAVDEFSEPREPGEAVDDFAEPVEAQSPAEPMIPRLAPAAVAPTLGPPGGFTADWRGARQGPRDSQGRDPYDSAAALEPHRWGESQREGREPPELQDPGERRGSPDAHEQSRVLDPHDEPTTSFDASEPEATPVPVVPLDAESLEPVEPIVEWPDEEARKIVALRLVSGTGERFAGRAVRQALAAEGFLLGKYEIFHKPGPDARAVLSAASLTKPGTFNLSTMDAQRFGGLSLFAVLPGPLSPLATFDELLMTARALNDRLRGALQDERGEPLTPMRGASIRDGLTATATAAAPVVGAAAAPPVVGSPGNTSPA